MENLFQPAERGGGLQRGLQVYVRQTGAQTGLYTFSSNGDGHLAGQIIATKPPVGHPKRWWKVREPSSNPLDSGLGIILICGLDLNCQPPPSLLFNYNSRQVWLRSVP